MPFLTFVEKIKVHIKEIDDQHQALINLINELHDAVINDNGDETVSIVFPELINYTMFHFFAEEEYMVKYSAPRFYEHKKEHAILIDQILKLYEQYKDGFKINLAVMDFLKDWLINHTLSLDIELGHYLLEKKVV
jgi:hemerythrin